MKKNYIYRYIFWKQILVFQEHTSSKDVLDQHRWQIDWGEFDRNTHSLTHDVPEGRSIYKYTHTQLLPTGQWIHTQPNPAGCLLLVHTHTNAPQRHTLSPCRVGWLTVLLMTGGSSWCFPSFRLPVAWVRWHPQVQWWAPLELCRSTRIWLCVCVCVDVYMHVFVSEEVGGSVIHRSESRRQKADVTHHCQTNAYTDINATPATDLVSPPLLATHTLTQMPVGVDEWTLLLLILMYYSCKIAQMLTENPYSTKWGWENDDRMIIFQSTVNLKE